MNPSRPRPRFYISAVEEEFATLRATIAEIVESLGYVAEQVPLARSNAVDLRVMLRNRIDECDGLIQIVGDGYGPEPKDSFPSFERTSYAEFELRYAQARGKQVWLLFAGPGVTRNREISQLDLPAHAGHADPAGHQAERRKLQAAYRQSLQLESPSGSWFQSDEELEQAVFKQSQQAKGLRESHPLWNQAPTLAPIPQPKGLPETKRPQPAARKGTAALLIAAAALVVIAGGVGLVVKNGQSSSAKRDAQNNLSNSEAMTAAEAKAAEQRERAERNYQSGKKALLEATDVPDLMGSMGDLDRLRKHTLEAIERVKASAAGEDDTAGMRKLDDVLAEQTPGTAVDYVRRQWGAMLALAKDRSGAGRHPKALLTACEAAMDHGDYELAAEMLDAVTKTLPEWTEARWLNCDFLTLQAGPRAERSGKRTEARDFYAKAVEQAQTLSSKEPSPKAAQALAASSYSLEKISNELAEKEDQAQLRVLTAAYNKAESNGGTAAEWQAFLDNFGMMDLSTTDKDDRILGDARVKLRNQKRETQIADATQAKRIASLQTRIAKVEEDLNKVKDEIESGRKTFDESLALINRLTNNKKTPVVAGSAAYWQCQHASERIQKVESSAKPLTDRRDRLSKDLTELQDQLKELTGTVSVR